LRRAVISRLLCHTIVIKDEISREFGIDFDEHFAKSFAASNRPAGTARPPRQRRDPRHLLGRIFIRNLAMYVDPYLEQQQLIAKPLFSKTL